MGEDGQRKYYFNYLKRVSNTTAGGRNMRSTKIKFKICRFHDDLKAGELPSLSVGD